MCISDAMNTLIVVVVVAVVVLTCFIPVFMQGTAIA